ncbi:hypothetical protein [Fictibacillus barbaricus]|nr:hypothetical protein [Fictibacillus barbaricus]
MNEDTPFRVTSKEESGLEGLVIEAGYFLLTLSKYPVRANAQSTETYA